jgi:heat-inducible transcriptional repressor
MELTERKKKILKAIIEDYVATAEPVGSKAIAKQLGGDVSSATIRNDMADLSDMGYLEQPHKSAGRVPSPKGYRLYVDELMEQHRLSKSETEKLNAALHIKMQELDRIISKAGQYVSNLTEYPAYALAAGKNSMTVKRFDLLYVDRASVITVVMTSDDRVKSGVVRTQIELEAGQLPALAAVLNSEFTSMSASDMSKKLMSMSAHTPPAAFMLLSSAIDFAAGVLDAASRAEVFTAGANRILNLPEYRDIDKANQLMSYLSDDEAQLPVTDDSSPMKILIGPENVNAALKDTSVVVASYDIGDNMRGLIGVVGPVRMNYATVAARLSYFAEGMARLFGKNELPAGADVKEDDDK